MKTIFSKNILMERGWAKNAKISLTDDGIISNIEENVLEGIVDKNYELIIPGMPNIHSHAFQRIMAGMAENRYSEDDDFWTWRNHMYQLANKLQPDDLYHISKKLYSEMLENGFTSVAEFHYIHNDINGLPYTNPIATSEAMIRAALDVGINITILPTFYSHSNFGGQAPNHLQRRFINTPESFLNMIKLLRKKYEDCKEVNVGISFHSLRAITLEELKEILSDEQVRNNDFPIHMHLAEQQKEVDDCLSWSGKRPVEWFLDNVLDKNLVNNERWTLIHCTHMNELETQRLANSKAIIGFCPTTESNLGDGIPNFLEFVKYGGKWGIGTDSNIEINVFGELKTLEYSQRLKKEKRNILPKIGDSSGQVLYQGALIGGSKSLGLDCAIKIGNRANFVALDNFDLVPSILSKYLNSNNRLLDLAIFASSNKSIISNVIIAGRELLVNRLHFQNEEICKQYYNVFEKVANVFFHQNDLPNQDEKINKIQTILDNGILSSELNYVDLISGSQLGVRIRS